MPHSLPELELKRSELLRQIASLGDFRSGSITSIRGRCGKPNCHCHKPNHPGHGPNFRLTRKRRGKTVSETFPNPADLQKAQREVAEFHRFQQWARDLVEVNEQICRLRPAPPQPSTAQEKKRRKPSSARLQKKLT
jgi:hypothetical protein